MGNYVELNELMELAARGRVKLRAREYPLDDVNAAIDEFVGAGTRAVG